MVLEVFRNDGESINMSMALMVTSEVKEIFKETDGAIKSNEKDYYMQKLKFLLPDDKPEEVVELLNNISNLSSLCTVRITKK